MNAPIPEASLPLSFRIGQAIIALGLIALIIFLAVGLRSGDSSGGFMYGGLVLCVLALIGLLGRVVWGRFLVSVVGVLLCMNSCGEMMPIPGDPPEESGLWALFGDLPPVWLGWTVIMLVMLLILIPLVMVGWRKAYFRKAWW